MTPRALMSISLALAAGCVSPPAMPDAGTPGACFDNRDCPPGPLFFCNTITSQCAPGCLVKADCSAEVRKENALAVCAGQLGCECDRGQCVAALCASDLDCGPTQACRDGACVVPPEASTVAGCAVFPDYLVLR